MEHQQITPECRQIFKNIDEKLDGLIARADKINGRYDKHIEESIGYRRKLDEIWAGIHFSKWVIMVIFGSGLIWQIFFR